MPIVFNKRDPIYVQVIQDFKEKIAAGVLQPGQQVPSRRELASQYKINPNTVQRAYKEMEAEKLIFTAGNSPSRITEDQSILKAVRREWIDQAVTEFVESIRPIDIPLEEVMGMIQEKMTHSENQPLKEEHHD
ncbi:GntR family transcriptional regulator [Atopococcus tabaci]|uniref:GntR family transcriptional regulator n=1 Tax=Atopococcus tabaci TaxID=269774 RepID=UPI00240A5491|nr:GntR family transcriptional regulator [Atopococcus tabaci]